jgi:BlaI family transcriptional regulator, penicillinase repressor
MMRKSSLRTLSRRERQIMDILFQRGESGVSDVVEALPDPPSYSAVRALLRILEEKGQVKHKGVGKKYVYLPAEVPGVVAKSSIEHVVSTHFGGNLERVVATLLSSKNLPTDDELSRIEDLIRQARIRSKRDGDVQT